jgi:hypothetical protein
VKKGAVLAAFRDDPSVNAGAYLSISVALLDYFDEYSGQQRANLYSTGAKSTTSIIVNAVLRI